MYISHVRWILIISMYICICVYLNILPMENFHELSQYQPQERYICNMTQKTVQEERNMSAISSTSRLVKYFPDVSKIFDNHVPNILICENNLPIKFPINRYIISLLFLHLITFIPYTFKLLWEIPISPIRTPPHFKYFPLKHVPNICSNIYLIKSYTKDFPWFLCTSKHESLPKKKNVIHMRSCQNSLFIL
jgi:hypothetical protein